MESLVCEDEVFVVDAESYQEPVNLDVNRVMWTDDSVRVMIRAAEFWMICSLLMSLAGSQVRRALQ